MDISLIDKNLKVESSINKKNIVWFDVRKAPFKLYGLYNGESEQVFRRMPEDVAKATSNGVFGLHTNTAGGRVRFATSSPYIAIKCSTPGVCLMSHMTLNGSSGFDLYTVKNGVHTYNATFSVPTDKKTGYESVAEGWQGGVMRDYEINFPLYNNVDSLYIGIDSGSEIATGGEYRNILPAVFYGSSITQGGCASRPGLSYQAMISRKLDLDYVNLGFSGNAKGEDAIVDYMAELPMSVFVCDYDYNAPDKDWLMNTHEKMYKKVRAKNPDLPIVFISAPNFDTSFDISAFRRDIVYNTAARREVIFTTYSNAMRSGDKNVFYIDGESLFGGDGRGECTVDGVHPNDIGFYRMADRIGSVIEKILF